MLKTILGATASAVLATSAFAQAYPSQPIKFIVPYTQGTGMDTIARVTGAKLAARLGQPRGAGIHAALIPGTLRPVANKDNDYLIDRRAQKEKRSFSGVAGLGIQDSSLQESMGPIQDRPRERLVQTDRAIILARRRLHATALGIDEKPELPALDPTSHGVRSASVLLPKDENVETWAKAALIASQQNPLYSL